MDAHTALIESVSGKSVLVVGDVMLDEYVWTQARRISAEAPVPVLEVQSRSYHPGGAANVAANIAALGGRPSLVGVLGGDDAGKRLTAVLRERGIATDGLVTDPARPTTTKTRLVAHNQQVARLDTEARMPLPLPLEQRLLALVGDRLAGADVCVIADYAKGAASNAVCRSLIESASRLGKKVIIDPKGTDYRKYRGATLVKPNVADVGHVLKRDLDGDADVHEAGRQLIELLHGATVLITRGAEGMLLFQAGKDIWQVRSLARRVYDVTGAGDTVVSLLALFLAADAGLEHAVHLANVGAGVVVGKFGTATLTREELLQELQRLPESESSQHLLTSLAGSAVG